VGFLSSSWLILHNEACAGLVFSSIITPKYSLYIFPAETLWIGPNPTIMQAFLLWRLSVLYPPQSLRLYGQPLKPRWRIPYTYRSRILWTCRVSIRGVPSRFLGCALCQDNCQSPHFTWTQWNLSRRLWSVVWDQLQWIQCNEP
jgi:hypothetical protein